MRLSYEVEDGRKSVTLESDDTDRSGDVNDWSVLFQWAVDFESGEGASEEKGDASDVLYVDDKPIDIRPMRAQESFKTGQEEERKAVVDYLLGRNLGNFARDIENGAHLAVK